MKTSKIELIELGASEPFLERYLKQVNFSQAESNVADLVGDENTYDDLLWLAGKKIKTQRIIRFACDCALINIEKIKPYTDKYDLILDVLKNPRKTRVAGDAMRDATRDAVAMVNDVAAEASDVVAVAARSAARSTAIAADTVYWAAAADTRAAEISRESKQKVDDLLREMFNEID